MKICRGVVDSGHFVIAGGLFGKFGQTCRCVPIEKGGRDGRGGWGLLVIPFFLTTPVVFRVDRRFFTGAIKATRQKTTGMNTLVTVGAFAAWFDSSLATLIPCLTVMM